MKKYLLFTCFIAVMFLQCYGQTNKKEFTDSFQQDSCTFKASGRTAYFILEPGYQLILEGKEGKKTVRLVITVLNETREINGIDTRVVEEHESENGEIVEISRNFFAICRQTGSVFYFGEEVDMYKNGKIESL